MDLIAEIREAAEAVAAALRAGRIPRPVRPGARAALGEAFAACEAGRADLELLRRLDRLARPVPPRIPRSPRLGFRPLAGAVDRRLVARLAAPARLCERVVARVDRFLAVTGAAPLDLAVRPPGEAAPPDLEMELPDA